MSHRLWWVVVSAAAALFVVPLGVEPMTGQSSAVIVLANPQAIPAGDEFAIFMSAEGLPDGEARVSIDPVGVGADGFVLRLATTSLWCPGPRSFDCEPCPPGRRCFSRHTTIDPRLSPGRYTMPVTLVDALGRTRRTQLAVDVLAPVDKDRDGLPDPWEYKYFGYAPDTPEFGAGGDPDGDGVTNLEEFRRDTNPKARYYQYFAEGSAGDRAPAHALRVDVAGRSGRTTAWVRVIGDGGRRRVADMSGNSSEDWMSPPGGLDSWAYPADRVVAFVVESTEPAVAARHVSYGSPPFGTAPFRSRSMTPSSRWYFADGGTDGTLDTFFLTYNPTGAPVELFITYRLADGTIARRSRYAIEPDTRTTIWTNVDDAPLGRVEASAEILASAPIVVERAWRFAPPGRTVTQATATPGTDRPSTRWIIPDVDAGARFETSVVIANPSAQAAMVDVTLFFADRSQASAGRVRVPPGGRTTMPIPQLAVLGGARASVELVSANAVPVVVERTLRGRDAAGSWRQATVGAPVPAARWVIPYMISGSSTELIVTNPSSIDAQVELRFGRADSYIYDSPVYKTITVPAHARFVYPVLSSDPAFPSTPGTLRATSQPTARGIADIVVEAISYEDGEHGPRTRASGLLGTPIP